MKNFMEKLNKRLFPFVVALVLFLATFPPVTSYAAWAEALDYTKMDYRVRYGTDYNTVSFTLPDNNYYFTLTDVTNDKLIKRPYGKKSITFTGQVDGLYDLYIYPAGTFGIDLTHIPVGSVLRFKVRLYESNDQEGEINEWGPYDGGIARMGRHYLNDDGDWIDPDAVEKEPVEALSGIYDFELVVEDFEGAKSIVPKIRFKYITTYYQTTIRVDVISATLDMKISTAFWTQWQNEQNGKAIEEIGNKIDQSTGKIVNGTPEQNATADESNNEMSAAAGKLDTLGDQLNSVDKPSVDNINVSADKLLGGMAATTMLTAPVLEIWKNPVALSILTVVVTIVLISWVFFGKK